MSAAFPEIDAYIEDRAKLIGAKLEQYIALVREKHPTLSDAAAHALRNGKKIRPVLCVAACEASGGNIKRAMPAACAVEMIHCYSLIHDDLPSMDDDDMRRGLPSVHKMFGEATAILAGDLLLTDSFGLLAVEGKSAGIEDAKLIEIIKTVSDCAGKSGMAVGQMMDLESADTADEKKTAEINSLKTGALIEAAVKCGAIAAGANEKQMAPLERYSKAVGLAFQTVDDALDSEGRGDAKEKARALTSEAVGHLEDFSGDKNTLAGLALRLCERAK
ncbi:MAG: polyprenyl synthetase family protein [Thermodesulfobacteriota bacterium]